jgi:hypothetical protein
MATQNKTQPRQPRRPILFHRREVVQEDCVAVIRVSWFRQGRVKKVEEMVLFATDDETDWLDMVRCASLQALQCGADVSLIGSWSLADIGFDLEEDEG